MSKLSIEQHGLLETRIFDLDNLESANPPASQNGYPHNNVHARRSSSGGHKYLTSAPGWLRKKWIILVVVVIVLLVSGTTLNKGKDFRVPNVHRPPAGPPVPPLFEEGGPHHDGDGGKWGSKGAIQQWKKSKDFKIIGLIFFGRPSLVSILDCYLKKNLVTSGGWLDEVHFVVNTDKQDDIKYLDGLITTSDLYKKIVLPKLGYNEVWSNAVEKKHMYIKIDDDIVSLQDILYSSNDQRRSHKRDWAKLPCDFALLLLPPYMDANRFLVDLLQR